MNIAVFGGSFNPIHLGHLINASFAVNEGGMDRVIFLPSGNHPLKQSKLFVEGNIRLRMVESAIEGDDRFIVEDYELKKSELSYTYDTMLYLNEKYSKDNLYFLIGSDLLQELPIWHKIEELSLITTFLVVNRYNEDDKTIEERIEELKKTYNAKFKLINIPYITISSSKIRAMIGNGETVRYMVPDGVLKIIEDEGLYV